MQPRENQSALLSYAVPFCSTSGAMYPWVPLGGRQGVRIIRTCPPDKMFTADPEVLASLITGDRGHGAPAQT